MRQRLEVRDVRKNGEIVVGADGSAHDDRALNWALDEARARGTGVVFVHAFEFSPLAASDPYGSPELLDVYRRDAQGLLDRVLDRARYLAPDVQVTAELQYGPVGATLGEAAQGAAMLVVGSRSRGGFAGAPLGSSSACVHHATCPVVVIPPPERTGQPERHEECGPVATREATEGPLPERHTSSAIVGGEAVVRTQGLTRRFDHLVAVDHLDLEVRRGEVFGLLGRNGAGKTTVIKMLITLLEPSEGTASVGGYDIRTASARVRRVIGYVPQLLSADGSLTAWENLMVFARLYHIPRSGRRRRVMDALTFMGLDHAAHTLVRDFSGGMIRRLEIAQSMLHRPAVLFLDEPTVGLDPAARRAVWDELRRLIRSEGTTLVLTTHDMEEADELCDRVAIMDHGRIVTAGTPDELKARLGPDATLDDVFIASCGEQAEMEGGFRDVARTRRTVDRLG